MLIEKARVTARLKEIGYPYLKRESSREYVGLVSRLRPLMSDGERKLYQRGLRSAKPGHFAAMEYDGGALDYIGLGRLSVGLLRVWCMSEHGEIEEELTGVKPDCGQFQQWSRRPAE